MADNLIFPICFDLEAGVKAAEKNADKYLRQLENAIKSRPVKLDVVINAEDGSISAIQKEMGSLVKEFNKLSEAQRVFNRTSGEYTPEAQKLIAKYAELTAATQTYAQSLQQITSAARKHTEEQLKEQQRELKAYEDYWKRKEAENAKQAQADIAAGDRQRKAQQQRITQEQAADARRYQEWLRQKNQEAVETERIERQKQQSRERTISQQNREFAEERRLQQQRQEAISASLRAEYQRIEAKKQAEAASRRELQMLNQQYAAEERRQKLTAQEARIKGLQKLRSTLQAEENTIANINVKLQVHQQRLQQAEIGSRAWRKSAEEVKRLTAELDKANQKTRELTGQTSTSAGKQAAAVRQVSEEYKRQDGYISRLLKRMAVYAGYSAIGGFLRNVREVTAEFELQRVSLGAIIQDQQRANQLFAEIKSFALTSPLKILDLTKYTKQVAAYGFETEKLFDTTKMLADISVGLGADMSRATLFLGQVFATGYLRAAELRQATELGIPLVDKLAKKLEELNGRVYSAADVMDLISKRAISFEMVESVFKDMTSAGGEFYNMQVKQSQTLFGMWSKLGDAAALMYDEIGNTSSVNAGMKATLGLLESLMRNWKTTARVLDTVGVALAVYVAVLKGTALATTKLTGVTALLNLAHRQQIIQTPKMVAAIIGQNAATKTSTVLTKAHTGAVLRQATATTLLTKGFWKLTAAMLANPWAAVAAAIATVGVALIHFIGNTETAAERTEKLNNSVASLKNLDDTVTPLIDTYDELINKTERTVEEQKKLSEVTHELAKRYPGAITAIGNFGNEVDLAADKLNKLYQAEKQARMENTRYELQKTEDKIRETNGEIEKLQKQLEGGTKVVYKRLGDSGLRTKKVVPLTEEAKGEILNRIDVLRLGEKKDGQGGLVGLQQTAEEARRALGLIPSEAAQAVEKFGAWKKELRSFRIEIEKGQSVQLFDDSTIDQFKSLDEAMAQTAKDYKEQTELAERYDKALAKMSATADSRAKVEQAFAEATARANKDMAVLTRFGYKPTDFDKDRGGTPSDNRLQVLKEEISLVGKLYKEYQDMEKLQGVSKAEESMRKLYSGTLKELADTYGIELPKSVDSYQKALKKLRTEMQKQMGGIKDKNKKRQYEIALRELNYTIEKADKDDAQRKIEEQLKELADRISRTKTAREFYDKVLGMTGDVNLAGKVALSIYGSSGNDLKQQLAKQIKKLTNGLELPDGIISADNIVDYKALREWADLNEKELGNTYAELVKIAEQGQKDLAKTYEGYLKDLEKAKSYSDKRIELARYTANKIAEIQASTLPDKEKERLTAGYKQREIQKQGELEWETFKEMPMYIQMFDDLDNASSTMLTNMRDKLGELQSVWGSTLNPTQLKELQSRMNEVEAQLAKKNPFKTLGDAMKRYRELSKGGTQKDAEKRLVDATKQREAAQKKLNMALAVEATARERYNNAVKEYGEDSGQAKAAKSFLDAAQNATDEVRIFVGQTELSEEEAQRLAKAWQDVKDAIGLSLGEVFQIMGSLGDLASGIGKITEAFGGSEEDVQYWNDLADGINEITSGIQGMVQAAISMNPLAIVTSAISLIPNMISGFSKVFNAGKIRKANKEIKRQQELLEQLEYSYKRLEEAADKLFGGDYIANYNQQMQVLQAQQMAYLKQAEAERSKGKDADEAKIKEYENAARDTADKIKQMQDDLTAHFLGSDRASLAREFAQSWIDAKLSFANTADAIKSKYSEMIKSMIIEGAAAKIIDQILAPMWEEVGKMLEKNDIEGATSHVVENLDQFVSDADGALTILWKKLEARGYDMKELLDTTSGGPSGISRDIASASEESINGLAAGINTQNYYISHVPQIAENVAAMKVLLESGRSETLPTEAAGWTDWQQQAMENYNAIARNTAETVVECRKIAERCTEMAEDIHRVIVPRGTKGSHGVQVYM